MKIAATHLDGSAISSATIDGINTKVTLAPPTSSGTVTITGSAPTSSTITKNGGFDASTDKTRAIFTVGLVPDNNTGRSITVKQTDYTNKGVITSATIESSKSYTTPASLFSCGKIGDHDYVLIAGTKWATQNLAISDSGKKAWKGSNSSAVKVPGTNEDVKVGDYFQWAAYAGYNGGTSAANKGLLLYTSFTNKKCGDGTDGFNSGSKAFSKANAPYGGTDYIQYTATVGTMYLRKTDDVANIILGDNWRMPTSAEFQAMREATYWAWDATDCGYYVFKPGLGTSGAANDRGTFDTSKDNKSKALLFFPAAGYGGSSGLASAGTYGSYWSSTLYSSSSAYDLDAVSGSVIPQSNSSRFYGLSVRPVSD